MKIRVDPDKCQGHARCYGLAPEIFDVDDYGQASVIVDVVPPELEEKARLAVANARVSSSTSAIASAVRARRLMRVKDAAAASANTMALKVNAVV